MPKRRLLRILIRAAIVLAVIYAGFLGAIFHAVHQPPERFGRFMAKIPMPLFFVVPFETMWGSARGGRLEPGDAAPDFDLEMADDRSARVRLSSFRGDRPVVLVFGSYT